MDLLKGVKPLDHLLTAALVALAVLLGVGNVVAGTADPDLAHAQDSHSWLMVPVFVLAALPILWRRRAVLPALAVSIAVLAASLPAFGWVTRCGFALPLSVAFAYAVARYAGDRPRQTVGLLAVFALQVVTLVMDSSTGGVGALALSVPAAALLYGIGLVVRSRSAKPTDEPTLSLQSA